MDNVQLTTKGGVMKMQVKERLGLVLFILVLCAACIDVVEANVCVSRHTTSGYADTACGGCSAFSTSVCGGGVEGYAIAKRDGTNYYGYSDYSGFCPLPYEEKPGGPAGECDLLATICGGAPPGGTFWDYDPDESVCMAIEGAPEVGLVRGLFGTSSEANGHCTQGEGTQSPCTLVSDSGGECSAQYPSVTGMASLRMYEKKGEPVGESSYWYCYMSSGSCPAGWTTHATTQQCEKVCGAGEAWDDWAQACRAAASNDCVDAPGNQLTSYTEAPDSANVVQSYCVNSCIYDWSFGNAGSARVSYQWDTYVNTTNSCSGADWEQEGTGTGTDGQDGSGVGDSDTDPIPDDGNATNEPATDEGQEIISGQLDELITIADAIEKDTTDIALNTNDQKQLLTDIKNNTSTAGDGFTDNGCLVAPACSGSPLECAKLEKLWEIECNQSDTGDRLATAAVDCTTAPVCSGDEIDCQILNENWQSRCDLRGFDTLPDTTSTDYDAPITENYDVGAAMAGVTNQSGFLAAGACPSEVLNLSLGTQTLDMQLICDYAETINPLVMILAGLVAGRIFFSGIVGV